MTSQTIHVKPGDSVTIIADQPVVVTPPPPPPPASAGGYGSIWADSLNNMQVGGAQNQQQSHRFRAAASGPLNTVRFYWIDGSGYSAGSGGTIEVSVQADDGSGKPDGTRLASTIFTPNATSGVMKDNTVRFQLLTFANPAQVVGGQRYHIVCRNVASSPASDFVSVDGLWLFATIDPNQPRFSDADWAHLYRPSGGAWTQRDQQTPILDINIGGAHQGQGYMEVWIRRDPRSISGVQKVRQRFTPKVNVAASKLLLRLRRVSGSSPLTVTIAGQSATVPASSIAIGVVGQDHGGDTLVTVPLPVSLVAGTEYTLALSTASDTVYSAYAVERGSGYGFDPATYNADGYAEHTADGATWTGFAGGARNADLQFYFAP